MRPRQPSTFDLVRQARAQQEDAQRALDAARAEGLTLQAAEILAYLIKVPSNARELAAALDLSLSTVRGILKRLFRDQLVEWVDGPAPVGRPPVGSEPRGRIRLSPQGLRVADRLRRPAAPK